MPLPSGGQVARNHPLFRAAPRISKNPAVKEKLLQNAVGYQHSGIYNHVAANRADYGEIPICIANSRYALVGVFHAVRVFCSGFAVSDNELSGREAND